MHPGSDIAGRRVVCTLILLLLTGQTKEFPANTPFHVDPGIICTVSGFAKEGCASPDTRFVLFVDGVLQRSQIDIDLVQTDPTFYLAKRFLTNYPVGMVGTHTFSYSAFIDGDLVASGDTTVTFT